MKGVSAPKTYRWGTPAEWLQHHITRTRDGDQGSAALDLAVIARALARELDSDSIQDLFQYEMEEDGYFRP